MLLNGKNIDEIGESDLLTLIGEEESRTLDFKGHGYRYKDKADEKWKGELWIDVSSFANSVGGWIICGMTDKEGKADELCGLGEIDPDLERRRLEQCIKSGVEPQVPGIQIRVKELPNTGKGKAIVIYIPRSFAAPHRVKDSRKFHVRRSNWNDEMNIDEVRSAFNLSESYVERIRGFRKQRIEALTIKDNEEIPVLLRDGVRIVLHSIPLMFSEPSSSTDLSVFQSKYPAWWVHQINFHYGRYNLEGFVRPNGIEKPLDRMDGYIQVYRNGIVECVELFLTYKPKDWHLITLPLVEDMVLKFCRIALTVQENLGVSSPLVFMLSLTGVKDCILFSGENDFFDLIDHPPIPLLRNTLLIPDIVIEDYSNDFPQLIKSSLDMLWNTAGRQCSTSYDENGVWKRKDR